MKIRTALIALILAAAACATPSADQYKGAIEVVGTMHLMQLEGGCWVLQAGEELDDVQVYLLDGELLPELMTEGATVTLIIRPNPKAASVCQVGTVAEVLEIIDFDEPQD